MDYNSLNKIKTMSHNDMYTLTNKEMGKLFLN